ncbi:UDP-N-acetylmuramate dehydrogenase [Microterricola viridarii]|uniref:UDP-N-acetylenolpyruvoylglucosamine reductase n=1 Tax=Microterricola viridarii TaxID=412690 RepID=A0A120I178_9MICO|nr:UDP-N-acetylmuramate dehydrogenase [Microterricola viridarii]AMB59644.1 UDP-N-acetylenolpyruvoylglucosamine reductase [Microterricola viridarii]
MSEETVALSALTTMQVGGVPERMVTATTQAELIEAARDLWDDDGAWLVLAGGSNTVASDEPFEGTVLRVATRGIEVLPTDAAAPDRVRVRVQAGEPWDELVAYTVDRGWSGIEALSGIPGSTGAAPVQNIGAYGQELDSSLVSIDFLDYLSGEVSRVPAAELELGYRTSALKQGRQGIVLTVELELHDTAGEQAVLGGALAQPIAYAQLATALGVQLGDRVSVQQVRDAVLALRASKGMVLNAEDRDTASAGSFFTNPIVRENFARSLPAAAPRWPLVPDARDEAVPLGAAAEGSPLDAFLAHQAELTAATVDVRAAASNESLVKLSAAWLIENAGIRRGFSLPGSRAAISSKHTLAITNTGGASAEEVAQLARFVQGRVQAEFGVILHPEPVLVGLEL